MGAFLGYAGMDVGKEHKKIVVEFRRIRREQARHRQCIGKNAELSPKNVR